MTTTNLAMTLPTVGASSDTWGDTLNADLNLIDAAFTRNKYTNFGAISAYADADNTKYVMSGYGSSWALTPTKTGKVRFRVTGTLTESNVAGSAEIKGLYYGTGTAPVQGVAVTGTNALTNSLIFKPLVAGAQGIFHAEVEITGLTLATAYWFDIAFGSVLAGTATLAPSSVIIEEFY